MVDARGRYKILDESRCIRVTACATYGIENIECNSFEYSVLPGSLTPCTEFQRALKLHSRRSVSHQDAWIRLTAWADSGRTRQYLRLKRRKKGPSETEIPHRRSKATAVTQHTKAFVLVLNLKS